MMNLTPEVFDLEIGGRAYTVEFCREGIKEADSLGAATDDDMGFYNRTVIVLYAGLKKHQPHITIQSVKKILENALDEGYTLEDFADIIDEFTVWYKALFTESSGTGKKIQSRRTKQETRHTDLSIV